ncbi:transglycosylase SLT domain-containing protein [Ferrimonas lipolytica]|uniref:Transglycosylase SLT domain-containing protein n=1 Tax=Ferrimonas lipolytica TaxID=2724191 RepID=A0A6H1UAI6_9GAMM|nr:transglycosylase SLT domain-containing protein [Ferrimonas lipolytica]QIZ76061.1 transglycosylase SLT domain-containing protein [Ferrimonas lipolytica]
MALQLRHGLGIGLSLILLFSSSVTAASIEQQRAWYNQAREALKLKKNNAYFSLRQKLDDYPLTPYLDYRFRQNQVASLTPQQAIEILQDLANTPLYNQFKHSYLASHGKQKNWANFLQVSPERPNNERLQCYYYRARLATGDHKTAFAGADVLWLSGKSRDKACDPLFDAWQKQGNRTQDKIWQRMLLAYDAKQYSLLRYLNSTLTASNRQHGDLLLRLYKHPQELRFRAGLASSTMGQQIVVRALGKMARKTPKKAWQQWQKWRPVLSKSNVQSSARTLLYRSLIDDYWSEEHNLILAEFGTDKLKQQRLRQTIFVSDWSDTAYWIGQLSAQAQQQSEWQFWQGYVLIQSGQRQQATQIWTSLAKRRNYYGFLAAQQLNLPYSMQSNLPVVSKQDRQQVLQHQGYARIHELMALDKHYDAKQELRWLISRLSSSEQAALLAISHEKQWHFLTVQGTIQTKMWDALEWRFPTAYGDHFLQFAEMRQLDMALLQALARRESALYPNARSGANAHGLMQLLPTTAKETARKIGAPYRQVDDLYQPKRNIQLGSAYYQQLYSRYDNNRLLASAAYNAGPHRVKSWLKRSKGKLSAAQFVATIPFKETRDYVEAILSYQLIYATLDDRTLPLMTEGEQSYRY